MSDPTAQEPTMEEILASIRRIISEDDQPPAAEPAVAHAPAPHPAPAAHTAPEPVTVHRAPEIEDEEDEDVLELNEPAPQPHASVGDLDVFDAPKPAPRPEPALAAPKPEPAPVFVHEHDEPDDHGLISGHVASAAASHFDALAQSIAMPAANRTLEDVVREMLRPLLKDWLDQHLPGMVEQAVRDEVERISRRRY